MLCPLIDTKFPFSFFNLKLVFEMKTLFSNIHHCGPQRNFSMYFYPGSTSIVKLWATPDCLPLNIIPWAISHSRLNLSNDKKSTGLGDRLYFSDTVLTLNTERSLILSSGRKLISGSCLEVSIIDPSNEKFV